MRLKTLALGMTVGALLATGLTIGVTEASASGPGTTYYGCLAKGKLTSVGTVAPTCKASSTLISWNSQGPTGPQGPVGPTGPTGPQGPSGTTGIFGTNDNSSYAGMYTGAQCTLGDVVLTASAAVAENWMPAKGQTLTITGNPSLYSLMGTNYGGNGTSDFDLPNLTAAAPDGLTYIICVSGVYP